MGMVQVDTLYDAYRDGPQRSGDRSGGITILSAADVDAVLALPTTLEMAMAGQADVFRAFSLSHDASLPGIPSIQMPQRIVLSSASSKTLFMPSRIETAGGTGIKIVSVPLRGDAGLPATTLVLDEQTGQVSGIVNARKLTAFRNACGSALFLQVAPKPRGKPQNLLIFGSGLQATTHADVFIRLFDIQRVTFVGRADTTRLANAAKNLAASHPRVEVKYGVSKSPFGTEYSSPAGTTSQDVARFNLSQAVHDAHVIITCTSSTIPLFRSVDVTSQSHIILIGSYQPAMHEIETDLIRRAGVLLVDSEEGCAAEAGELIDADVAKGTGQMIELGRALSDPGILQEHLDGDIYIYKSVGIGLQDIAIASMCLQEAGKMQLGTQLPDYDAAA